MINVLQYILLPSAASRLISKEEMAEIVLESINKLYHNAAFNKLEINDVYAVVSEIITKKIKNKKHVYASHEDLSNLTDITYATFFSQIITNNHKNNEKTTI